MSQGIWLSKTGEVTNIQLFAVLRHQLLHCFAFIVAKPLDLILCEAKVSAKVLFRAVSITSALPSLQHQLALLSSKCAHAIQQNRRTGVSALRCLMVK